MLRAGLMRFVERGEMGKSGQSERKIRKIG
jgi:hypothetical protein